MIMKDPKAAYLPQIRARLTTNNRNPPLVPLAPNVLSERPRRSCPFFDDNVSSKTNGPRHDNDHDDFRDIKILPTADEVLAFGQAIYMPKKNLDSPHPLGYGPLRLLDTHFRHLRYDSTESLRDICYSAAQHVFLSKISIANLDCPFQETVSGNRYHIYPDARIEDLIAHETHGMQLTLSFECPASLRGPAMHKSNRLKSGMLCALMMLNAENQEFSLMYFDIHSCQSTMAFQSRGGGGRRAGVQLSFHNNVNYEDVLQITRLAHGLCPSTNLILVEFPKVLYAGFYHPLHRLQQLSADDVAFHKYIAPTGTPTRDHSRKSTIDISPPVYCSQPNFLFDLSPLTETPSAKSPSDFTDHAVTGTVQDLTATTTLDEGQAVAMCNSLGREIAFTQGPPGTGKTFLGVALAGVLLASRPASKCGPVLVVCLTNHALDAFLAGLKSAGVDKLLRIGGGSREEWTKPINLAERVRKQRYNRADLGDFRGLSSSKKHSFKELSSWCQSVSNKIEFGRPNWHEIQPVIKEYHPGIHDQLATATDSPDAQSFAFDYWASGGDLHHIGDLQKELAGCLIKSFHSRSDNDTSALVQRMLDQISLHAKDSSNGAGQHDIWRLTPSRRQRLLADWSTHIDQEAAANDLAFMHLQYLELIRADKILKNKKELQVMQQQNVIGMTTTACASRWEVLRALKPEILICEEAGEVMEAHVLCSLLPSLKHAVLIGDPLQLRPGVKEQMMTMETSTGSMYRLDESLFERIMMPKSSLSFRLPTSQLNIQRRMHPQIADISRITYPFLKDYESTQSHPNPKGVADRLFWLDHRATEAHASENSESISNDHEVQIVRAFVRYLLRGSNYECGDIAVITPYTAQLAKLHEALSSSCSVWLSDRDRELLLDGGKLELEDERCTGKTDVEMHDLLRIATVDNFQGEEAKVIIFSTVRSGGKAGFLKTPNRINVACSRARDGFYVVGNATTLAQVPMWREVLKVFDAASARGPALRLHCDRHPQHNISATNPHDFDAFEECAEACGTQLVCGHTCLERCHDLGLHARIPCLQPCEKTLPCGHQCSKTCSEKCGGCSRVTENIKLECGHHGTKYCSGKVTECQEIVEERNLSCGRHTVEIACGGEQSHYTCHEECGIKLQCGHDCPGKCEQCKSVSHHQKCIIGCDKVLPCGHECKATCHHGEECPPCSEKCQKKCPHGRCRLLCSEPCNPCNHTKKGACSHEDTKGALCSLPSIGMPCSLPCTKLLPCGHVCPSLHSEICIPADLCPQCQGRGFPDQTLLYNPACGHLFEVGRSDSLNLQGLFQCDQAGNIIGFESEKTGILHQPVCPVCASHLSARRYGTISGLIDLPKILDQHLSRLGSKLHSLAMTVELQQQRLKHSFPSFIHNIRPNPLAAAINSHAILGRHREIHALLSDIVKFRDQHVHQFQNSMSAIHRLLPNLVPKYNIMFRLRADVLEYRAMHASISDKFRVVAHLIKLEDPSGELQRQALTMLRFIHAECVAGVAYCRNALQNPHLTTNVCLTSEIGLQQVRFWLLANASLQALCHADVPVPDFSMSVNGSILNANLKNIKTASGNYPSTHGQFSETATVFLELIQTRMHTLDRDAVFAWLETIPIVHSARARDIEKAWGQHAHGFTTACAKMHPYSKCTFPNFCPECGEWKETEEEKTARCDMHLHEDKFLAAMKARA